MASLAGPLLHCSPPVLLWPPPWPHAPSWAGAWGARPPHPRRAGCGQLRREEVLQGRGSCGRLASRLCPGEGRGQPRRQPRSLAALPRPAPASSCLLARRSPRKAAEPQGPQARRLPGLGSAGLRLASSSFCAACLSRGVVAFPGGSFSGQHSQGSAFAGAAALCPAGFVQPGQRRSHPTSIPDKGPCQARPDSGGGEDSV